MIVKAVVVVVENVAGFSFVSKPGKLVDTFFYSSVKLMNHNASLLAVKRVYF